MNDRTFQDRAPKRKPGRGAKNSRPSAPQLRQLEFLEDRCVPSYAPVGLEFLVNTFTTGDQGYPSTAMDSSGNFVVTWASLGQVNGIDVFAQRFNASGVAQGSPFLVNQYTTGDQLLPSVAMAANGTFVITWTNKAPVDGHGDSVWARRYAANGTPLANEFRVNTYTGYHQNDSSIAMDSNGNFVITWSSGTDDYFASTQDGRLYGVYAQRYNSAGATVGGEFRVNSSTDSAEGLSHVAMDDNGNMVIAFARIDDLLGNANANIYARRYVNGVAQGNNFLVNSFTAETQFSPAVAMDSSGNFVITWSSNHDDLATLRTNVYARRYNASGTAQGAEFLVNTYTTGEQLGAAIAMDNSGNFLISWQSGAPASPAPPPNQQQDGSLYGIYAQRFTSAGVKSGNEFRANTFTTGNQYLPAVGMQKSNGDLVIAWTSGSAQDGSGYGVYAQRFKLNSPPVADVGGPYFVTEGGSVQFNASASYDPDLDPLTYSWDINGDSVYGDATGVTPTLTWAELNALGILDGPDLRTVGVRVTDPYGATSTATGAALVVSNAAPTGTISTASTAIVRGEPTTYTLIANDPSPADQAANFTFFIDWNGDFTFDQTIVGPSGTTVSHVFANTGSFNIRLAILDKDGGYFPEYLLPTTVVHWALKPNPSNSLLTDLVWGGAPAGGGIVIYGTGVDTVEVRDTSWNLLAPAFTGVTGDVVFHGQGNADTVYTGNIHNMRAYLGGGNDTLQAFFTSGGNFYISGGAGNDSVLLLNPNNMAVEFDAGNGDNSFGIVDSTGGTYTYVGGNDYDEIILLGGSGITLNADLGAGDDFLLNAAISSNTTILGGGGADIILSIAEGTNYIDAGDGNDLVVGGLEYSTTNNTILGGNGNDVIMGGGGASSLSGGAGEDLIIAGSLSLDLFGEEEIPGIIQVWLQWNEPDPIATRIDYLTGVQTGGIIDPAYVLSAGTTVLDNGAVDVALGDGDADWILYDFGQDSSDFTLGVDLRMDLG